MPHADFTAPPVPAPWQLTGSGFILVYHFPRAFIQHNAFIPADMLSHFSGGPSVVLLVNYRQSDVGPYQELLFIPGRFNYEGRQVSSISRIYVSTGASVVNGRRNWAIPKEQANFDWVEQANGREQVQLYHQGQNLAQLTLQTVGPAWPMSSSLIPLNWRTLWQLNNGCRLFTQPQGAGKIKWARLVNVKINPAYFPNLSQGRLLAAFKVTDFKLTFPVAKISL